MDQLLQKRQSSLGMAIRVWVPNTRRVFDPTDTDMGIIFYSWVAPILDPNRDGYETGIFFHPMDTRYFTTAIILDCE
jgi:hypothetical protein